MTTMRDHTPGPWHGCQKGECQCGIIWADDGETVIATVYGPTQQGDGIKGPATVPSSEQKIANAKLIAYAPSMLDTIINQGQRMDQLKREVDRLTAELAELRKSMKLKPSRKFING